MRAERFEDLVAWQKARELARVIYELTRTRALHDDFGLARQMQRAAVSVMANIAEGFGREGSAEFHRFVTIARGSCFELQSHLYLAADLGYLSGNDLEHVGARIDEVARILASLRAKLGAAR
ncbi:MAG: ribosomal protein [Acidobacteria bacterium]|nr:ribosomal protein [Acidobacteriota bacterium]